MTDTTKPVAVKALEWVKSHIASWNDDWHTTTPFIYTIRCADENGWKWSTHGVVGHVSTPEAAKAAAQADYDARIRSAMSTETAAPAPEGDLMWLDEATKQKLREALRFSASRSVMSAEDERRILSALSEAPAPEKRAELARWNIDHSAGRPILTLDGCSVIEAEDADYLMRLIELDQVCAALATTEGPDNG